MPPMLVSIQVGRPQWHGAPGAAHPMDRPWQTGFFKGPVAGRVRVGRTNIAGDGQADLSVHGGPDKAGLAYSADHYPAWRERLGDLPFGAFGENLTISGLTEPDVCVGDVWRCGEVRFEVSQPRQPCWKLARRWRVKELPAWVVETGRSGWYFRVRTEGEIEAGTPFELESRPHAGFTIASASDVFYRRKDDRPANAAWAACPALAAAWRDEFAWRG